VSKKPTLPKRSNAKKKSATDKQCDSLPQALRLEVLTEAGYRCAVPTCRGILAIDLHHIVEVHRGGPDTLENLLALCPTCHALYHRGVIKAISIQTWKNFLKGYARGPSVDHSVAVYHDIVRFIDTSLNLRRWNEYSDSVVRGLAPETFVDGVQQLQSRLFRIIWPSKMPDLESRIKELFDHLSHFVNFYLKQGRVDNPHGYYRPNKFYKDRPYETEQRWRAAALYNLWSSICINLIFNVVVALNAFADEVRKSLDPGFHILTGRFVVNDAQGVLESSKLSSCEYLPTSYDDTTKLLQMYADGESGKTDLLATPVSTTSSLVQPGPPFASKAATVPVSDSAQADVNRS
jgi:hypothetical protein